MRYRFALFLGFIFFLSPLSWGAGDNEGSSWRAGQYISFHDPSSGTSINGKITEIKNGEATVAWIENHVKVSAKVPVGTLNKPLLTKIVMPGSSSSPGEVGWEFKVGDRSFLLDRFGRDASGKFIILPHQLPENMWKKGMIVSIPRSNGNKTNAFIDGVDGNGNVTARWIENGQLERRGPYNYTKLRLPSVDADESDSYYLLQVGDLKYKMDQYGYGFVFLNGVRAFLTPTQKLKPAAVDKGAENCPPQDPNLVAQDLMKDVEKVEAKLQVDEPKSSEEKNKKRAAVQSLLELAFTPTAPTVEDATREIVQKYLRLYLMGSINESNEPKPHEPLFSRVLAALKKKYGAVDENNIYNVASSEYVKQVCKGYYFYRNRALRSEGYEHQTTKPIKEGSQQFVQLKGSLLSAFKRDFPGHSYSARENRILLDEMKDYVSDFSKHDTSAEDVEAKQAKKLKKLEDEFKKSENPKDLFFGDPSLSNVDEKSKSH